MSIQVKKILLAICLILNFSILAQNKIEEIKLHVYKGELQTANEKITEFLKSDCPIKDKIFLHRTQGDIYKIEGNIDAAHSSWIKSNEYGSSTYAKGDFHLAWSYALISNYYYEKIYTDLAVVYADSCAALIQNLTLEQQKEIEVYKIWNILAQSYKQKSQGLTNQEVRANYINIQSYYHKSIEFINQQNINRQELAVTYRLLGNSYLDLIFYSKKDDKEYYLNYNQATEYFNLSLGIFKKEFKSQHFEISKTLFVLGLLNFYAKDIEHNSKAIEFFEHSLSNYDSNSSGSIDIYHIPNKEDYLMTCSYLTKAYLKEFKNEPNIKLLQKAEEVNKTAIKVWEEINSSFTSENTNQNLAIYSIMPFEEKIAIEISKMETGLTYSIDEIFQANQRLKYYDLLKTAEVQSQYTNTLVKGIQSKLKPDELFLDFHINIATQKIVILKISKHKTDLILTSFTTLGAVSDFKKSIVDFDFNKYVELGQLLYVELIEPCKIMDQDIILCLDGILNNIPFEALLCSDNNIETKDYRKLDYLFMKNNIQYVLNPQMFRNKEMQTTDLNITAFAPNQSDYSQLPFSSLFVENLKMKYSSSIFKGSKATKEQYLNSTSSVLHLSGHGFIDSDYSLSSGLLFSDSLLQLDDVSKMSLTPQLVVLNVCNSSLGKIYQGDGINGFVRAYHANGVTATLSNNWEVDDKVSNELLTNFYSFLHDGNTTIEALNLAKVDLIQNASNSKMASPYYWAGHKLVGEELNFNQPKNDNILLDGIFTVLGLSALLVLLIYLIKRK